MESRVVCGSAVRLLRIVPIQGELGHTISGHFNHVQYFPLLRKEFGTIEIDTRDDTGHDVPFEHGMVTVTLHFRRRKSVLCQDLCKTEHNSLVNNTHSCLISNMAEPRHFPRALRPLPKRTPFHHHTSCWTEMIP